jgi:hypothetical protein
LPVGFPGIEAETRGDRRLLRRRPFDPAREADAQRSAIAAWRSREFMRCAVNLSARRMQGQRPFSAVIVKDGKVIAELEQGDLDGNDDRAREISAIRSACAAPNFSSPAATSTGCSLPHIASPPSTGRASTASSSPTRARTPPRSASTMNFSIAR